MDFHNNNNINNILITGTTGCKFWVNNNYCIILETFPYFSTVSCHHKRNGPGLSSIESECLSCLTSFQAT